MSRSRRIKLIAAAIFTIGLMSSPAFAQGPLDPALRAFLIAQYPRADDNMEKEGPTRVKTARVMRQDGGYDIIAYISGRSWCGSGGCTLMILERDRGTFRILGRMAVTRLPVRQLTTSSHGHPDIAVDVGGGGIQAGYTARLRYDGKAYPANPTASPGIPMTGKIRGKILIAAPADNSPDSVNGDLLYK